MRKGLLLLVLLILMSGCSSSSLEEAVRNSGYDHDQPDILYQDDENGIVIFLTKNSQDEYMIVQSTYKKTLFDNFKVDSNNNYGVIVDISNRYEFITLDAIGNESDNPKHLVWGGVYQYPGAEVVNYSVISEDGDEIYSSSVEINSKHVFVDFLQDDSYISGAEKVYYEVLDNEGNILYTQ
ncbi:hypothetical protein [Ornithinibacillus halophilus]|uniref:Uncharacterized protein n=1 Tax=Ornithinibacillus halophilus TaxID=930117 RepID=A0A1M5HR92_9BACI|nr:hypothetical protein [Ornithinibacillus halophilus]SHG18484.1 hypothetical protein SAMN05216225_101920 [Ornithinibacillus halophilus]